jgi:hypothetical protein
MFPPLFANPAAQVAFVLLMPLLVLAVGYFAAYAVHSLFVVIEQTAAGFDRVAWPHETFFDWFAKLFTFLVLLFILLFPIGFLLPSLDFHAGPGAALLVASICFVIVWLIFPVVLLSSLSGPSRFTLLRWEIVKGLARCWPCLLAFYGLTGVMQFLAVGGLYFVVAGWREIDLMTTPPGMTNPVALLSLVAGVPVAALLCSTGLLWYARLLGRLGWMLQIVEPHAEDEVRDDVITAELVEESQSSFDSPAPPAPAKALPLGLPAPSVVGETYAMVDEPPPSPPERPAFRWQPGQMPSPAPPRSEWRDQPRGPSDRPPDLTEEKPEPCTAPRVASLVEPKVVFFPWYRTSLWAWLAITFGVAVFALLARLPFSA